MKRKDKINMTTRVLLFICGISLLFVLFVPVWQIDLVAPQYPEGLVLQIYAHKLAGNVDIINGLNHYIGMKTLHTEDFFEFKVLPGIIIFFVAFFFATVIYAGRKLMTILCIAFVAFGVLAMVDFWRWEYDYGHNLNPDAAIIVPGMAYQPPLIGFKQLLNFGAYSMPHTGGWIFVGVGAILLFSTVYEWKNKIKINKNFAALPFILLPALIMNSCSTEPQPIRIGQDNCDFCKMGISDERFGAEIVTKKSKIYKFDDGHCIKAFLEAKIVPPEEISGIYFVDFIEPHQFINVNDAHFLQSPNLRSPMNGNIAAFSNAESLAKTLPQFYGNTISWEDIQK